MSTPRVQAATWKLIWNGWCTARRFQQRRCQKNTCKLGCSKTAEDSIEHYVHCPVVVKVAALRLRLYDLSLADFLLASASMSKERIAKTVLLTYAVFRATNMYRHKSSKPSRQEAFDAVESYLRSASVGHRGCTEMLDSVLAHSTDATPSTCRGTAVLAPARSHDVSFSGHAQVPPIAGIDQAALNSADVHVQWVWPSHAPSGNVERCVSLVPSTGCKRRRE